MKYAAFAKASRKKKKSNSPNETRQMRKLGTNFAFEL